MATSTLESITSTLSGLGINPVSDGAHVFVRQDKDFKIRIECYLGSGETMFKIGNSNYTAQTEYKDNVMTYAVVVTDKNSCLYSVGGGAKDTFPTSELKSAATEANKIFDASYKARYN